MNRLKVAYGAFLFYSRRKSTDHYTEDNTPSHILGDDVHPMQRCSQDNGLLENAPEKGLRTENLGPGNTQGGFQSTSSPGDQSSLDSIVYIRPLDVTQQLDADDQEHSPS